MVMDKEKVKLADVYPQTKDKLVKFKSDYNILHPSKEERLGTLGDTVDVLIEIATVKVPELEKRIKEHEDQIENLNAEIEGMAAFERERAKKVSEGMYND